MGNTQIGTMETQELIYKRRVERMRVTKGVRRGKLIDRVNAVKKRKHLSTKPKPPPKERPSESV